MNLCIFYLYTGSIDYRKWEGVILLEKIVIVTMNPILGKYVQAPTKNEMLAMMSKRQVEQQSSIVSFGQILSYNSESVEVIDKNNDKDMSLKIIKSKQNPDIYIIASEFDMVCLEEFCWFFLREHWDKIKTLALLFKFYKPNTGKKNDFTISIENLSYVLCECMAQKQLDYVIFSKQVDYISKYLFLKEY